MKKSLLLFFPLTALLSSCGAFGAVQALVVINDIRDMQKTTEVAPRYNDFKMVVTGSDGKYEAGTYVYSPTNDYYSITTATTFKGAYEIGDFNRNLVTIDASGNVTKETDVDKISEFHTYMDNVVKEYTETLIDTVSKFVEAYATAGGTLEGYTVTLASSGDGNFSMSMTHGEVYGIYEFDKYVPTHVHDKGATNEVEIVYTYGTSESDRPIRQ